MIIYLVTNKANGKRYVGQTIRSLNTRWSAHCNKGDALFNAINKYGKENFTIEQIDSASTQDELNNKEIQWIQTHNSQAPNGYNIRAGGNSGGALSEETKKKLSDYQKANPREYTEEWRKKASERTSGEKNPMFGKSPHWDKKYSKEHCENISKSQLGKKLSEETKIKISKKKKGQRYETKAQYPFLVFDKNTNEVIGEWKSQKQCAMDLQIHQQNINKCLKNKRKFVGNYTFKKKEE